MLAILMGGGLVLFGIGNSSVGGGLFDAFKGQSKSGSGLVADRIDKNEKKLDAAPKDKTVLKALVRDWYQQANLEADPNTGQYTDTGKERLAKADEYWKRYLAVEKRKPDASLASLMIQVYGQGGLNKPADGATAAEIVAVSQKSAQAYLQLTQFAALAGQTRKADLAGRKAIQLATKRERSTVKALVKQAKQLPAASTTEQPSG